MNDTTPLSIEAFFTRDLANQGKEFDLKLPDGKPSGHKIRLRHTSSDAFRKASVEKTKELALILTLPEDQREEEIFKANTRLLSALVVDWTLETPCTKENVATLLTEAGTVREMVNLVCSEDKTFFANG